MLKIFNHMFLGGELLSVLVMVSVQRHHMFVLQIAKVLDISLIIQPQHLGHSRRVNFVYGSSLK